MIYCIVMHPVMVRGSGQHLQLDLLLNNMEVRVLESQTLTSQLSSAPNLLCSVSLCSLEKENYDVWAKVVRLNQDIEREKKKSEELELKLKNMERLQEDLEKKNKMLEEEIKTIAKSRSKSDAKTN